MPRRHGPGVALPSSVQKLRLFSCGRRLNGWRCLKCGQTRTPQGATHQIHYFSLLSVSSDRSSLRCHVQRIMDPSNPTFYIFTQPIITVSQLATVALHCYNIRATHATNKQMQLVRATNHMAERTHIPRCPHSQCSPGFGYNRQHYPARETDAGATCFIPCQAISLQSRRPRSVLAKTTNL